MDATRVSVSFDGEMQATAPPATQTLFENEDNDAYLMQLMILDQQNKRNKEYVPRVSDASRRPHRLDGVIGNLFMDGRDTLTCDQCAMNTIKADLALWPDLKRNVHVAIAVDLRTGPDIHQCFCGYFSFRLHDLEHHLMTSTSMGTEPDPDRHEVIAGLLHRIGQIDMHEECRRKLIAVVTEEGLAGHADHKH